MLKVKTFLKNNIIPILFLTIVLLMTIGYALYGQTLNLNGDVTLQKVGRIEITSASVLSSECSNLTDYSNPTYEGMHIEFRLKSRSSSFTATYLITVSNNSNVPYTYTGFPVNAVIEGYDYVPNVTSEITRADTGEAFDAGEIIESGESVTIKLKLSFSLDRSQGELTIVVNGDVSASQDNSGSLIASISPFTGDLRGEGTIAEFKLDVINTFKYNRIFNLSSSNENIIIVDTNGNQINSFSISANSTQSYTVYLKVKQGSIFLTNQTQTNMILSSNMIDDVDLGTITLDVDKDINATDHDKPEIGNVSIKISENNPVVGEAIVSWSRLDTGGSPIINYYIELYNEDTGEVKKFETGNAVTSYTVSGLNAGNYYVKIYGEDEAGNIGYDDCNSNNLYCPKSDSIYLQWVFNVTTSLSRLSSSGASTANIYSSYETTLSLTSWFGYSLPSSVTITMGGVTLTSGSDYTYDSGSGKIVINRVTGDININASASDASCLVEGTKIRLADGSYKNVEDINYDDLLMVYDHENGGVTYEYPIWIEKFKMADSYQKTTFDDGSVLNTYGSHSVFSYDKMNFVIVNDRRNFHVGSNIVKIDENGNKKIVTVKKIEIINKPINYYHVSSTRYHNVLANDFLTTDGTGVTTYLYSFNDDLTWGPDRDEFLAKNDIFTYGFLKKFFPKYLYYGYRMAEGKNPYNQGKLSIEYIAELLNINNTKALMKDSLGNTLWMVTTSDDKVTSSNKNKFLKKEGSYYMLPEPKNSNGFIGWLNTGDNEVYKPGDKVEVLYGTHFIAKYE